MITIIDLESTLNAFCWNASFALSITAISAYDIFGIFKIPSERKIFSFLYRNIIVSDIETSDHSNSIIFETTSCSTFRTRRSIVISIITIFISFTNSISAISQTGFVDDDIFCFTNDIIRFTSDYFIFW